jgi:hypothetical protein
MFASPDDGAFCGTIPGCKGIRPSSWLCIGSWQSAEARDISSGRGCGGVLFTSLDTRLELAMIRISFIDAVGGVSAVVDDGLSESLSRLFEEVGLG